MPENKSQDYFNLNTVILCFIVAFSSLTIIFHHKHRTLVIDLTPNKYYIAGFKQHFFVVFFFSSLGHFTPKPIYL